jgi:hypothetical protein
VLGGLVSGVVVDDEGRPVAGASVFNSGDAPLPVSATTDAEGRFRLEDLQVGTVYVFAQKAGYRFAGLRTRTGSDVTVTLRGAGEAPAGAKPAAGVSRDEQLQLARRLVDQVWNLPPGHRNQVLQRTLEALARIDPEQALRRSAEAGGRHDKQVRAVVAEKVAETDADEALALIAPLGCATSRRAPGRWRKPVRS